MSQQEKKRERPLPIGKTRHTLLGDVVDMVVGLGGEFMELGAAEELI